MTTFLSPSSLFGTSSSQMLQSKFGRKGRNELFHGKVSEKWLASLRHRLGQRIPGTPRITVLVRWWGVVHVQTLPLCRLEWRGIATKSVLFPANLLHWLKWEHQYRSGNADPRVRVCLSTSQSLRHNSAGPCCSTDLDVICTERVPVPEVLDLYPS